MNPVRRLLNLLLCLVLALNGAALAHAGAASGHAHGAPVDAAADAVQVDVEQIESTAHAADAAAPCHEASKPDGSHAQMPMPMPATLGALDASDAADAPCCNDTAACDHACMPAAASAVLVPERIPPATARFRGAVPAVALQPRTPPPAHPPIRPPIAV